MLRLPILGELDRGMRARIYLCVGPTDMITVTWPGGTVA